MAAAAWQHMPGKMRLRSAALQPLRAGPRWQRPTAIAKAAFTAQPGLLPFRLGAFKVACEAGLPVIPVTIRGTRRMLRGDQWWPQFSPVSVTVGEPLAPDGRDFSAAVRLRDGVRAAILENMDEPDIQRPSEPVEDL